MMSDLGAVGQKQAMPPLDTRAPRPPVVRLRRSAVAVACMAAASLLAGSLAWAFIVGPELRTATQDGDAKGEAAVRGAVRPSDVVTGRPATYGQLDQLPPPRKLKTQATTATEPPAPQPPPPSAKPRAPASGLALQAREAGLFFPTASQSPAPQTAAIAGPDRDYATVYNPHALLDPVSPYELKAGAVIPALLLTGIDTARAGPVVATVTDNIYDTVSGRHLIVPQGTRLIGRHEGESRHGDRRVFLSWDRLILPNGKSLVLTQEPGVDAQGMIGAEGRVERRLGSLLVASLFAGAITTLGQIARDGDGSGGWLGDAGDAASIEAAQTGGKLIERELQVRPSISLQPGARVRVLVTRDLVLEPYAP